MDILAVGTLGLVLGSFVNALVWRLHEQSKRHKKASKVPGKDLSILHGRSMCPDCHHTLAAQDLVPVFSWLSLRGRCRYCKKPISVQYPLVELLTALLFVVAYISWPFGLNVQGIFQLGFLGLYIVFFMALAVYDVRWFLLPDRLVFPLIGMSAIQSISMALWHGDIVRLWAPLAGAAVIYGLFWGLYQVSNGEWIGGGDVKLAIALGLIAGSPINALLVIFFASLFGTIVSAPLLLRGKSGLAQHIPFGPYLLAACFIVVLYADKFILWYQHSLL